MQRIATHLGRLGWGKGACAVFVLCATTAIGIPAQTLTTLANFDGGNGFGPVGGLIQAPDGNFYGTASSYGTADDGYGFIVFKVAPSGTLTTLYSSTGEAEGELPDGGLVQATDGYLYGTTWRGGADNCPVPLGGDPPGCGTAFRISLAGTFESLHLFAKVDGTNPVAGLIQAANGNFYRTAEWGGASGYGTVFTMTPSGALATLYSFPTQGNPVAPLVQGSDGNFYGTTLSGGGTVFKITAAGALTTLYTFCAWPGCADGANLDAGLIQATDGNFYGTTTGGGAYGNYGTIFKITPAGQLTTLHSFSSTDGASPGGLIQATDGNFYGTADGGGANGYGTVFRITPAGQLTTLHSFISTDGANPSGVLVQGKDGSFYGTTGGGGSSNAGTIFSLSVPMTATPTPTYGTAARVFQDGGQWPDNTIYIFGDLGKVQSELVESTTSGFQAADPKITAITTVNPAGLSSGALSYSADSSDGAARGLAFRNFINNTGAPLTMKLNAVLSGYFLQEDGYTGYGSVAGAIHIFDGTTFASRVKASGETAGQFLLANYPRLQRRFKAQR